MKLKYSATLFIASTVVMLLLFASWQVHKSISEQFRQDISNSLQTVLATTQQAVLTWQQEQIRSTMVWANSAKMVRLTEALLITQKTPRALIDSLAQAELRQWLKTVLKGKGYLGYFIIDQNNISLASSRNSNIGTQNVLTLQPVYLPGIWSGKAAISQPMHSDVALQGKSKDYSHSIFVGAPIYNSTGKVIAVFTFRIDPDVGFSAILKRGRIGESGETYAFNKQGLLLSESRFNQQLRELGLVSADSHGILSISIRDPGSNMLAGESNPLIYERQPFTLAAKNAILGKDGINLDGYRDYRGVPVVGAWLWDKQLEMGFTTEQDIAEAYTNYNKIHNVIFALTSLAIILTILLTLALVWLKRKNLLEQQQRLELLREQKDLELKQAASLQQMILESAAEGVITINEYGKIISINSAAEKLFGYQQDEVIGKNVNLFMPEPHKSKHDSYLSRYQQTGKSTLIGGTRELEGQRKDGTIFPLDLSLSKSQVADERTFVGFVHDLTALKSAQEELHLLSRAVEQSPASVVITSPAGDIEYANPKFSEVTGYSMAEALGKNPKFLKSGHTSQQEYQQLWQTISAGKQWLGEFKNIKKNGEPYWESACISPIKNSNGEITHYLATKENITERKKTLQQLELAKEEAELANKTKSEFIANLSHEIRTPLNGIIGMANLLSDSKLNSKQHNYADKINSSSQILLGVINDLLDFSKIEAGKLAIENIEFELDRVLADISNVVAFKAEEKAIELLFDVEPSIPYYLHGDPLRLNQVLLNLVSNAVKFTEKGEIVIKIQPEQIRLNKIRLTFSISDSGIGLSKKQTRLLFKPFSQVDSSTTRKFGGTGLGLSICKQLVELMNGSISVTSELGKGSCFQFTAEFGIGNNERNYLPSLPLDLRELRVLIVDDCHMVLDVLRYQLESFGFNVDIASSGQQAMKKLLAADHEAPIQLVLMDWKMPKQDGLATAAQIKQSKQLSSIPVIIMHSMYKWDETKFEADQHGIDGYINKPIHRSALFDVIMTTFNHHTKPVKLDKDRTSRQLPHKYDLAGYQILLVEDNEINQEVASGLLKKYGLDVFIASNGLEALAALERIKVDLVLMDLQMPEMDGFQATKAIRAIDKYANLPVIAMTANAMIGDRERCIAAGMNDHIAKPIDPEKLFSSVAYWLGVQKAISTDVQNELENKSYILELNEFEVSTALPRLDGSIDLYLRLLGKFKTNFADYIEQINEQINFGDYESARALIHKLIGVAGNLSASNIYRVSSEIDQKLKVGMTAHLPEMLNELDQNMMLAFSEIDGLDIEHLEPSKIKTSTSLSLSSQLSDFNVLLQEYDASALKCLEQLRTPLHNKGLDEDFNKMKEFVNNYNFEKALEISRKIKI